MFVRSPGERQSRRADICRRKFPQWIPSSWINTAPPSRQWNVSLFHHIVDTHHSIWFVLPQSQQNGEPKPKTATHSSHLINGTLQGIRPWNRSRNRTEMLLISLLFVREKTQQHSLNISSEGKLGMIFEWLLVAVGGGWMTAYPYPYPYPSLCDVCTVYDLIWDLIKREAAKRKKK